MKNSANIWSQRLTQLLFNFSLKKLWDILSAFIQAQRIQLYISAFQENASNIFLSFLVLLWRAQYLLTRMWKPSLISHAHRTKYLVQLRKNRDRKKSLVTNIVKVALKLHCGSFSCIRSKIIIQYIVSGSKSFIDVVLYCLTLLGLSSGFSSYYDLKKAITLTVKIGKKFYNFTLSATFVLLFSSIWAIWGSDL